MADAVVAAWPRPHYEATGQRTSILFVCFGKAPLAELPLSRSRFGLPDAELVGRIGVHEHRRSVAGDWFEGWWSGPFGVIAEQDLQADFALLTESDVCVSLKVDLPDQRDLGPLQTVWGMARWLCARGAGVVLDVHAFRYRTRRTVEQLSLQQADVLRDVKLVLESEPTHEGLHLLHTRGLCKVARPELMCFVEPGDASLMGSALSHLARALMDGASAQRARLRVAEGVELATRASSSAELIASLGLEAAVDVVRSDGAPLAGVGRL